MFYIQFSPLRDDNLPLLTVAVSGDTLTINGEEFDFSPLKDGDILPASACGTDFIQGSVTKTGDDIAITLLMPYRANAPMAVTFPDPVAIEEGDVAVPTQLMEVTYGN